MNTNHMNKLLFLDCDSTLTSIEGIDELGRLKGPEVYAQVEELTHLAMNGSIPLGDVFSKRLELIRPTANECREVASQYIETVDPSAKEAVRVCQELGWQVTILSGGFVPCIRPLADFLGISSVCAVPLLFDQEGHYIDFDRSAPTSRNGGKPEVIASYKAQKAGPIFSCMVGDGISDHETSSEVDQFVACFTFVKRDKVADLASHSLTSLSQLPQMLPRRIAQAA